jgi:hypothetical protein
MNSFIIKKSKKRVTDIEKIYLWLFYNPLGQLLTKEEKRTLAAIISLYLATKKAFGSTKKQDTLVYSYLFSNEARGQICKDVKITRNNFNVRLHKLKEYNCIVKGKDSEYVLNKAVIPEIAKNGDIYINTTIRFI